MSMFSPREKFEPVSRPEDDRQTPFLIRLEAALETVKPLIPLGKFAETRSRRADAPRPGRTGKESIETDWHEEARKFLESEEGTVQRMTATELKVMMGWGMNALDGAETQLKDKAIELLFTRIRDLLLQGRGAPTLHDTLVMLHAIFRQPLGHFLRFAEQYAAQIEALQRELEFLARSPEYSIDKFAAGHVKNILQTLWKGMERLGHRDYPETPHHLLRDGSGVDADMHTGIDSATLKQAEIAERASTAIGARRSGRSDRQNRDNSGENARELSF